MSATQLHKEEWDRLADELCHHCCAWSNDMEGKDVKTIIEAYPAMMARVLESVFFGLSATAARDFVAEACAGNWERLHESDDDRSIPSATIAHDLVCDIFYCSDRWSWDRVLRNQWRYQTLVRRIKLGEKHD